MKNLLLIGFYFFGVLATSEAQKIDNEIIEDFKGNVITIHVDNNPVELKTWDKSYVEIRNTISINNNADNDKHDLVVSKDENEILIKSIVRYDELERMVISKNEDGEKVINPLKGFNNTKNNGLNENMRFGYDVVGSFQIFVPKDMNVKLKSTYGSININGEYLALNAHSVYGSVEAKLEDINHMLKLSLTATYKIVDLSIDNTSNAKFALNTTYGEVFSDLPIVSIKDGEISGEKGKCKSGNYTLNNGSVDVKLSATFSDIYIRKSN